MDKVATIDEILKKLNVLKARLEKDRAKLQKNQHGKIGPEREKKICYKLGTIRDHIFEAAKIRYDLMLADED